MQSVNFETCYISGYNDLFLCEGCSLVSHKFESFNIDVDSDCACTCCWYQYIQNYCFKQLCSDEEELNKLREYTSSVCSAAPIRTSIRPYKGAYAESDAGIELFLSDNSTLYRSLLSTERKDLYDLLGTVFNFETLPSVEDLVKRSSQYDENDDGLDAETLKSFEIFEKTDIDVEDHEDSADSFENDQDQDDKNGMIDDQIEDEDECNENEDECNEDGVDQDSGLDLDEVNKEEEKEYEYDDENDKSEDWQEEDDDDYEDNDDENDDDNDGNDENSKEFYDYDTLEVEQQEEGDYHDKAEEQEENHNETDQDSDRVDEDRDLDEFDQIEQSYLTLKKRALDKEKIKLAFSEGISSLRDVKDEISFDLVQDLFESFVDTPNDFFMIVKSFLGENRYNIFAGAYQESIERLKIQALPQPVSGRYCLEEESRFLTHKFSDIEDQESGLEIGGCFMNTIVESIRGGHCPSTEHCSCKCAVTKGLVQCIESYGKNLEDLLKIGRTEAVQFCDLATNDNGSSDTLIKSQSAYQTEYLIENEFKFLNDLKPIAESLDFSRELAEVQADLLWKTSTTENIGTNSDINAAIIIDKCELGVGELRDYLQFSLDSCDIRGLYQCKNSYKGTKCRDFKIEQNSCNNACCLQMKMTECAKTHCANKKPVKEFMKIANLVCTKYADPHITNGRAPYEEDELEPADSIGDLKPTPTQSSKDCGESEFEFRPPATRTDNVLDMLKRADTDVPVTDDVSFEENSYEDEELSVEALIKFGNSGNDKISKLHNRVCIINEFKPPYDTTGCDKREVKDCIKEGIENLKNDPEHFCPYCANDNVYDECRCACCFGKYFSKVCYDPNCKILKEKLRYKRYVKEVCKTKPKRKYKRDLEEFFVGDSSNFDERTTSFKKVSSRDKRFEVINIKNDLFTDLEHNRGKPIVEEHILVNDQPVNLHRDLLKNMQVSSLRSNKIHARSIETDAKYSEETDNNIESYNADLYSDQDENSEAGKAGLIKRLQKKNDRYNKAKSFAKKGSVNHRKKQRLPSTFSPSDRQKTAINPDKYDSRQQSQGRIKTSHRRKRPTPKHPSDRRKKGKTSKSTRDSRKYRSSSPELNVQSKLVHSVNKQHRGPKYFQAYSLPPNNTQTFKTVITPKLSTPVKIYKRDILYKANQVPNLDQKKQYIENLNGSGHTESSLNGTTLIPETIPEASTDFLNTCDDFSSTPTSTSCDSTSKSKKFRTVTRTLTRTRSDPELGATTSYSLVQSIQTSLSGSPSIQEAFYPEQTSITKVSETQQSTSSFTTATVTSFPQQFEDEDIHADEIIVQIAGDNQNVVTLEVPVTVTSIKTRFRPTTEIYTEFQATFTKVETVFDDTLTTTIAKRTLYRYKDITTETETATKSDTTTKIRTKVIPLTTVTEFEESDKTVTKLLTSTSTEIITWYEKTSTETATTYSGTVTTTAFKLTKTKYNKEGTTTETEIVTETVKTFRTKWYPEFTVTEFEEVITKYKTKWYPYTTTEFSSTTVSATTTTTTTTTSTSTIILLSNLSPLARPTPPGFAFPSILPRELKENEEIYTEVIKEIYEINDDGDILLKSEYVRSTDSEIKDGLEDDVTDKEIEEESDDVENKLEESINEDLNFQNLALRKFSSNNTLQQSKPNKTNHFFENFESSSNRAQSSSPFFLLGLGTTVLLIGACLFLTNPGDLTPRFTNEL